MRSMNNFVTEHNSRSMNNFVTELRCAGGLSVVDEDHVTPAMVKPHRGKFLAIPGGMGGQSSEGASTTNGTVAVKLDFNAADGGRRVAGPNGATANGAPNGHGAGVAPPSAGTSSFRHSRQVLLIEAPKSNFVKVFELLTQPIDLVLEKSMEWCDVRYPHKREQWFNCFCASMAWLAVFSYMMVTAATGLHDHYGIPMGVLGVTVCAIGNIF